MVRRIISPQGVLLFVTLLWASTFLVADEILKSSPPLIYLLLRFIPAAAIMMFYTSQKKNNHPQPLRKQRRHSLLKDGLYLGFLQAIALLLQVWGQKFISPARSAFLTAVSVPMVPLLGWILHKKKPSYFQIIAAVLGLVGQMLIAYPAGEKLSWNIGDALTIISAMAIALIILETSLRAPHYSTYEFSSIQTFFIAVIYTAILALVYLAPSIFPTKIVSFENDLFVPSKKLFLLIGYMAFICTILTFFLQTWSMTKLNPTQSAIILAVEPVFAAAIEFVVRGKLAWHGMYATIGAVLIFIALIVSEIKPQKKSDLKESY